MHTRILWQACRTYADTTFSLVVQALDDVIAHNRATAIRRLIRIKYRVDHPQDDSVELDSTPFVPPSSAPSIITIANKKKKQGSIDSTVVAPKKLTQKQQERMNAKKKPAQIVMSSSDEDEEMKEDQAAVTSNRQLAREEALADKLLAKEEADARGEDVDMDDDDDDEMLEASSEQLKKEVERTRKSLAKKGVPLIAPVNKVIDEAQDDKYLAIMEPLDTIKHSLKDEIKRDQIAQLFRETSRWTPPAHPTKLGMDDKMDSADLAVANVDKMRRRILRAVNNFVFAYDADVDRVYEYGEYRELFKRYNAYVQKEAQERAARQADDTLMKMSRSAEMKRKFIALNGFAGTPFAKISSDDIDQSHGSAMKKRKAAKAAAQAAVRNFKPNDPFEARIMARAAQQEAAAAPAAAAAAAAAAHR